MSKRYGWVPDVPDQRDHMFSLAGISAIALPPMVDLRPGMPPVYDQGTLGSCTANAVGVLCEFTQLEQKIKAVTPSRLFIYYNERMMAGYPIKEDTGATLRDGIKAVVKYGICAEKLWPYNIAKFANKPTKKAYSTAKLDLVTKYQRVQQTLPALKLALYQSNPVVFGFTVYESFEGEAVAKTGIVPMPGMSEQSLGGHAVTLCGYDDAKHAFLVRNSWGQEWGDGGYFWMPYAYVLNNSLADDFWTITFVS